MPIEGFISVSGTPEAKYFTVAPGRTAKVFTDYPEDDSPREIHIHCLENDLGGIIYKVDPEECAANKGGDTYDMIRKGYLGAVATLGAFRPLPIRTKAGEQGVLAVEHISDKFWFNPHNQRIEASH